MTFMDSGLRQNGDAFVIAGEAQQAQGWGGTSSFVHPHHNLLPSREKRLTETDAQWGKRINPSISLPFVPPGLKPFTKGRRTTNAFKNIRTAY